MYEEKIRDQQQYIADLRTGVVSIYNYYIQQIVTHFVISFSKLVVGNKSDIF